MSQPLSRGDRLPVLYHITGQVNIPIAEFTSRHLRYYPINIVYLFSFDKKTIYCSLKHSAQPSELTGPQSDLLHPG
jgi:hypothetical protein